MRSSINLHQSNLHVRQVNFAPQIAFGERYRKENVGMREELFRLLLPLSLFLLHRGLVVRRIAFGRVVRSLSR